MVASDGHHLRPAVSAPTPRPVAGAGCPLNDIEETTTSAIKKNCPSCGLSSSCSSSSNSSNSSGGVNGSNGTKLWQTPPSFLVKSTTTTSGNNTLQDDKFVPPSPKEFLRAYQAHVQEREQMAAGHGVAPLPLDATQVTDLIAALKSIGEKNEDPQEEEQKEANELVRLLTHRVPTGVNEAARIKAEWLSSVAKAKTTSSSFVSRERAVELLGTMRGGYNVATLVDLLSNPRAEIAALAARELSRNTILVFDAFFDVLALFEHEGCKAAGDVLKSWARADWFLSKPAVPDKITVTIFFVPGETNTDDLSPAPDAWSRPDIPLHAASMLKNPREGVKPLLPGVVGPLEQLRELREGTGFPVCYAGDVVGTGSSRKSATNSLLWWTGRDVDHVPNIKNGGVVIGGKIAPIFFNTLQDSGALPIECDVSGLATGDVVDIYPREGLVKRHGSATSEVVTTFTLKTPTLLDEVRAGGRIPLMIGRSLTAKARHALQHKAAIDDVFRMPGATTTGTTSQHHHRGYTLAQKIVGRACGLPAGKGILPGQYCEPVMTTVGSQDTTGPMTRDELESLACLSFSADLVVQSFCHTAAYPRPVDVKVHRTLPQFVTQRGGVSLRPGDGIIHAWLNRMLVPDTVGTGGDSHTRFPVGLSFPAGSGLVAFAAATGTMPLDMPESVLVRFTGALQPGVTLRDVVQSIPYTAAQMGLLTEAKENGPKKNVFSGRILEIQGLEDLSCEQAFELTDSSAERSAAACAIQLGEEAVVEHLKSNVIMLKWMISEGYGNVATLERRVARMEEWLADPVLLRADENAQYAAVIPIDLDQIKEPILARPNDPDASALLSDVAGTKVQEVFLGSCMTNITHFRAAANLLAQQQRQQQQQQAPPPPPPSTCLWVAPPTKMDKECLLQQGYYAVFSAAGARIEPPGCSLCMGNQARVAPKSTVVSTSTRNFPNRLGNGAQVYLASAELAAVVSMEGRFPTVAEYLRRMERLHAGGGGGVHSAAAGGDDTYRVLKFHELPDFVQRAAAVPISKESRSAARKLHADAKQVLSIPNPPPTSNHDHQPLASCSGRILYTETDEAPALATFMLYPILNKFSAVSNIDIVPCDISVAGRILSAFPETLHEDQRVPDNLAYLGRLAANDPQCSIVKLPNVSAPINQLQDCIAELRGKGYNIPLYPRVVKTEQEAAIQARYKKLAGSAVNPVLREGNSDRRVAAPVKEFAKQNPHFLGLWSKASKTHVAHMAKGDFYASEQSVSVKGPTAVQIELVPTDKDADSVLLKDNVCLLDKEVIDASFLSIRALRDFFEQEMKKAQDEEILFSLHLKATMMKVSDPILFGHCLTVYFKEAWDKHAATLRKLGVNPNLGLTSVYQKLREQLDADRAAAVIADFEACYEKRPWLAMVDSDHGITNLHAPNNVIIDASMPVVVRDSGKMYNKLGALEDCKCIIPDRSYAPIYQEIFDFVKSHGQFDVATMGDVDNVGLMAQKAEEYGSHDKTFQVPATGTVRVIDINTGQVYFEHDVEEGDIWRMCQTKDVAIRDWVKLAVTRARATGARTIFWLDKHRAHDRILLEKVNTYLMDHDTDGMDISTLRPVDAMRVSCERAKSGRDTIAVTGNVLRDYLTDLFPILELGTSAKMLSIVPLLTGTGGLYETGAGGSAPKHVQQFVREGHLRWDSLGEYLAMAVAYERLAETSGNAKAKMLGECLNKAISRLLQHRKNPSRKVNQIDNRAEHFYLALYWADYLHQEDPDAYGAVFRELSNHRGQIVDELRHCQGKPVDLGGVYLYDANKARVAMNPSETFNRILDSFGCLKE